ncbi:MAG: hypothetical protein ACYSX0_13490, partial [Planctomycetota bacterium]
MRAILLLSLLAAASCVDRDGLPVPDQPNVATEQGYVGSGACRGCHGPVLPAVFHASYYDDWAASAHGRTGDVIPSEQTVVADRDGDGTTDFRDGLDLRALPEWAAYAGFAPRLTADGESYAVTLGNRAFAIEALLGIGRHRQVYLTRMGESLYVLPVAY